jgi:hypothetical protein
VPTAAAAAGRGGAGAINHPEKSTAEGLIRAIPTMLAEGWVFVRVSDGLH